MVHDGAGGPAGSSGGRVSLLPHPAEIRPSLGLDGAQRSDRIERLYMSGRLAKSPVFVEVTPHELDGSVVVGMKHCGSGVVGLEPAGIDHVGTERLVL